MTTKNNDYDIIIIGSGPAGYVAAIRAAQLGFKTACIEKQKTFGGTCLNVGCIPSKALLESSHHYYFAQHQMSQHGITCDNVSLNLEKMHKRKENIVKIITSGVEFLLRKNKITRIKGHGQLTQNKKVSVTNNDTKQLLTAKHIILATGSSPTYLPFIKMDHKKIIDSTDALNLSQVPKHLIVLGAGVIGLEIGSIWHRLGAKVTIIEALETIIPMADEDIIKESTRSFQKKGFTILTQAKATTTTTKKTKLPTKLVIFL